MRISDWSSDVCSSDLLKIPAGSGRAGVTTALQMIVMAARLHGKAVFDGVYNRLNDEEGFIAECRGGHDCGFDGKTQIHPTQITAANDIFSTTPTALDASYSTIASQPQTRVVQCQIAYDTRCRVLERPP